MFDENRQSSESNQQQQPTADPVNEVELACRSVVAFFINELKIILDSCNKMLNTIEKQIASYTERYSILSDLIAVEASTYDVELELESVFKLNALFDLIRRIKNLSFRIRTRLIPIIESCKNKNYARALKKMKIKFFRIYFEFFIILQKYRKLL
jgi:hypothetical protein